MKKVVGKSILKVSKLINFLGGRDEEKEKSL